MEKYIPWIISLGMFIFAVLTYVRNGRKDNSAELQRAREEGAKNQKILCAIEDLAKKLDEVARKQITREEFTQWVENVKSLKHRMDRLEGEKHD